MKLDQAGDCSFRRICRVWASPLPRPGSRRVTQTGAGRVVLISQGYRGCGANTGNTKAQRGPRQGYVSGTTIPSTLCVAEPLSRIQ